MNCFGLKNVLQNLNEIYIYKIILIFNKEFFNNKIFNFYDIKIIFEKNDSKINENYDIASIEIEADKIIIQIKILK
jgi:hypothetical protein